MVEERSLDVRGMDCPKCEEVIRRSLGRLAGVIDADADHVAERVDVRFDPEQVSESAIKERILAAGFEVDQS